MTDCRHVFGPVPSRRLGHSLGIDLVPFKTCSYDCIYCQLGRTTEKTCRRKEYVPCDEVVREVERKLVEAGKIDYLTLSGSGEPTLYSPLKELILSLKHLTSIPVAVLTNGSLLWDDEVRAGLAEADLILPSLDAGSEELFRYINRPCSGLPFMKVIGGTIEFCSRYREKVWLEIFLLAGVNVTVKELRKLNAIVKKIDPAKVQLNTVKRPPAESFATAVPADVMRELTDRFDGRVEVVSDFSRPPNGADGMQNMGAEIANLLKRRPCTVNDIAGCLNLNRNEILKCLDSLEEGDGLRIELHEHDLYYSMKSTGIPLDAEKQ